MEIAINTNLGFNEAQNECWKMLQKYSILGCHLKGITRFRLSKFAFSRKSARLPATLNAHWQSRARAAASFSI